MARQPFKSKFNVIKDGSFTGEQIEGHRIKRILDQRLVEPNFDKTGARRWDEDVELDDGRILTIREIELED